jgi:predicted naringenin-chalcone synthase
MDQKSTRIIAVVLGILAIALAVLATVVRYTRGKPTDFAALVGAAACVFFLIVVNRRRGDKR